MSRELLKQCERTEKLIVQASKTHRKISRQAIAAMVELRSASDDGRMCGAFLVARLQKRAVAQWSLQRHEEDATAAAAAAAAAAFFWCLERRGRVYQDCGEKNVSDGDDDAAGVAVKSAGSLS